MRSAAITWKTWALGLPGMLVALTSASLTQAAPTAEVVEPELSELQETIHESLKLSVKERGPRHPWLVTVENTGEHDIHLAGDIRLLWFDVSVPGKKTKEKECRLPSSLLKAATSRETQIRLKAGEQYVRRVDPRFYCFSKGREETLVPGAIVKPRFGFPDKTKIRWSRGKRLIEIQAPAAPFVAVLAPPRELEDADDSETGKDESDTSDGPSVSDEELLAQLKEEGLRNVKGSVFALSSEYAVWSKDSGDPKADEPLQLTVTRGSDALSERSAQVTVAVKNTSKKNMPLFVRRELLTFEVLGPGGLAICEVAEGEGRHPELQAFTTIRAGSSFTMTSRLREFCPSGTFSRPGFYLVSASLKAEYSGAEHGIEAFTGTLSTFQPKPIRIRTGEDPFLIRVPLRRPGRASAPPAGTATPPPPPPAPPPPPTQPIDGHARIARTRGTHAPTVTAVLVAGHSSPILRHFFRRPDSALRKR